jgi:hypothetical protein
MPNLQTILESFRDGIGADLARLLASGQNSDLSIDEAAITAEDVFNILAKAKTRRAEGLPGSAE